MTFPYTPGYVAGCAVTGSVVAYGVTGSLALAFLAGATGAAAGVVAGRLHERTEALQGEPSYENALRRYFLDRKYRERVNKAFEKKR